MTSTKTLQNYFQNFHLQLRLPQTTLQLSRLYIYYSSMCIIVNHNYDEHSRRKFENFVRDILIDDIGKVRFCNTDRKIGTSWLLPTPFYVWKSLPYGVSLPSITTTWMWLTNQEQQAVDHNTIRQAPEIYIEVWVW